MKNINIKELYNFTKELKVLYVEDDTYFREQTFDILEDFFKNVDVAYNGLEGLNLYNEYYKNNNSYYDIVISDLNMPKMDGVTLVKEIYKININQPIIIVSAYNEAEYLNKLVELGINDFLQKPFKYDDLLKTLLSVIDN